MYKTIILEMIQSRPEMHERLRASRTLKSTLDDYAIELRRNHLAWIETLKEANQGMDLQSIKSMAMESAVEAMQEHMSQDETQLESLSLDQAIAFVRPHSSAE